MYQDPRSLDRFLKTSRGRAAGLWRRSGNRLIQLGFVAAPDLPPEVAAAFAEATLLVKLDQLALGIVRAAVEAETVISWAKDLPEDWGSGYWLRRFDAACSVAVPRVDDLGSVGYVLSVALPFEMTEPDRLFSLRTRLKVAGWGGRDEAPLLPYDPNAGPPPGRREPPH